MVPEMKIPSHITALYVFAVVNLMALFHVTLVDANIIIVNRFNETLGIIDRDKPANFGPELTEEGILGHVYYAGHNDGCKSLPPPPKPPKPYTNTTHKWIAIIRRHGCDFDVKVLNAQNASYVAALIHNVGSNDLVPMGSGKYGDQVKIPSAFIGQDDAMYLKDFSERTDITIIVDNRVPFNANLYLLPFAVVVGICFVLMVVFMIAKWIRDVRKKRRSRLSKEHLKKIPVKKFKKGDPYDVCAICLDEYEEGDKLRILPCAHAYHMKCIDPWLTKNKRTCPVCKRKVIPGDPDDSESDSDSDEEPSASENTPLLGASGGARNNNTFSNSGLPDAVRSDQVLGGSSNDSSSDGEGGVQSSGTFQNSLAEVHVPSLSRSLSRSPGSYGATATLKLTNEMPKVGSINSAYDEDKEAGAAGGAPHDDELYGAVGGVPSEFLQDNQVVVVNPKRRRAQPDDHDDEDVRFVDDYYQEELKGVLGESAMEESEQPSSSRKKDKEKEKEKKKKEKEKKKEQGTTLPKKPKKKKKRRDEVA